MKKSLLSLLFSMSVAFIVLAESPGAFLFNFTPGISVPLQVSIAEQTDDYYSIGGGIGVRGQYILPSVPFFITGGGIDFSIAPENQEVTNNDSSFTYLAFSGEAGLTFEPISNLTLGISVLPGYFLMLYEGSVGSGPFFGGELSAYYRIAKGFSLGLNGTYRNYWSLSQGGPAYHGVSINLGARISLGGSTGSNLKMDSIQFSPIFPVFYKYYDDNPIGSVSVRNEEKGTLSDVTVSFYISQYMDKPKVCRTLRQLKPGEVAEIPLYALFTDDVLGITEGTKVMAQILTEYTFQDERITTEHVESVEIQNRNAMTWDDDRKAASFITAKDPSVLTYAKGVVSTIRNVGTTEVNANLRSAMGLFESFSLYGLDYVIDPSTPYEEFSQNSMVIDFLQFPSQTLTYKAGDCDDLSILTCAALESVGIETALITVPGHIFMAFALNMDPREAERTFLNPDDIIYTEDNSWVPIEITFLDQGFLKAWQTGAKEWREAEVKDAAAFFPVHEAWSLYKPVGILSQESRIDVPDEDEVIELYLEALETFIEREISPRVETLRKKIVDRPQRSLRYINQLGVLYARFGLMDQARREFFMALEEGENPSVLVNLGNLAFIEEDFETARSYYERAYGVDSSNTNALLSMARVKYELEEYSEVWTYYERLKELEPEMAEKFDYLVSASQDTGRAGLSWVRESAVWDEEVEE